MVQKVRIVIALLALAGLVCCASHREAAEANRVVADTGGYGLRLIVKRKSTQQYEMFEISRLGKAGYSGGMAAVNGEPTYHMVAPPEAIEKFRAALEKCDWVAEKPSDRGPENVEPVTDVTLRLPSGRERMFVLHGPQPQVDIFIEIIKPLFANRHKGMLDRLPESTEPPKVLEGTNP